MMKKVGARFGGEPSGTYIFPEVSYAPEGVFSAAYLYSIVSEQGDLSTLIEGIPHYPVLRKSISFTGDPIAVSRRIKKGVYATSCNNIDETDGYRLEFDDGWVLIRLSGTEPKVRLMAEGIDKDTVNTLLKIGEKIVEGSIRGVKK
jgi:phosphoglucosamine mutase